MKIVILLLLLVCIPFLIKGQDSLKEIKLYNTWIKTMTNKKIKHIYTYEINEEDITVISKHKNEEGRVNYEADLRRIAINELDKISFRKTGNMLIGAVTAGSLGLFIGVGIMAAITKSNGNWSSMAGGFGAAMGFLGGMAIGVGVGSLKHYFAIRGNQESFDKVRSELEKRSIKYYY